MLIFFMNIVVSCCYIYRNFGFFVCCIFGIDNFIIFNSCGLGFIIQLYCLMMISWNGDIIDQFLQVSLFGNKIYYGLFQSYEDCLCSVFSLKFFLLIWCDFDGFLCSGGFLCWVINEELIRFIYIYVQGVYEVECVF